MKNFDAYSPAPKSRSNIFFYISFRIVPILFLIFFGTQYLSYSGWLNNLNINLKQTNENIVRQNKEFQKILSNLEKPSVLNRYSFPMFSIEPLELEYGNVIDPKKTILPDSIYLREVNAVQILADSVSLLYLITLDGMLISKVEALCYARAKIPEDQNLPINSFANHDNKIILTVLSKQSQPINILLKESEQAIIKEEGGNLLEWKPGLCNEKLNDVTKIALKKRLKITGCNPGNIHNPSWNTEAQLALIYFQEKNKLPSGTLNVETLERLGFEIRFVIVKK